MIISFERHEMKTDSDLSLNKPDARFPSSNTDNVFHVETFVHVGFGSLCLHLETIQNGIVCLVEEIPSSHFV